MTEAQKDAIRAEFLLLPASEIARRQGYTRQRIYQVLAQPPDEQKRALEQENGLSDFELTPNQ